MLKKFTVLLLAMLLALPFAAMAKDDDVELNYEIEGAGTGAQGTYLVKVTVISKKNKIDDELIARCAVHGVLFRGFASKEYRQNQRPLAGSAMAESEHADFFKDFFKKNGTARNYVSNVSSARQVVKSNKQYRITTTVTVNKEQLQHDLEAAGVIRGLNSGF